MTISDDQSGPNETRVPHPDDTDNTDHIGPSSQPTAQEIHTEQKASDRINLEVRVKALMAAFAVLLILALAGALAGIAFLALESNRASEANSALLKKVQETSNRLIDCTTPAGECYAEGQARTGKAVTSISEGTLRVISAALSCQADGITEQKELVRCTTNRSR